MIAEHGVTMTLDEARQMKENFLALLTQLEYDIKSGQVLPYKDMIEAVGNEYARMRTRLIAIAPEHGPGYGCWLLPPTTRSLSGHCRRWFTRRWRN